MHTCVTVSTYTIVTLTIQGLSADGHPKAMHPCVTVSMYAIVTLTIQGLSMDGQGNYGVHGYCDTGVHGLRVTDPWTVPGWSG